MYRPAAGQNRQGDLCEHTHVGTTVRFGAHAMNLEMVVEGVESAGDAAHLRELGYDYAQGFWYSAALPAEDFTAWLRQFNSASVPRIGRERARAS